MPSLDINFDYKKIQNKIKSNYIELKDCYAKITNGHVANYS